MACFFLEIGTLSIATMVVQTFNHSSTKRHLELKKWLVRTQILCTLYLVAPLWKQKQCDNVPSYSLPKADTTSNVCLSPSSNNLNMLMTLSSSSIWHTDLGQTHHAGWQLLLRSQVLISGKSSPRLQKQRNTAEDKKQCNHPLSEQLFSWVMLMTSEISRVHDTGR